MPKKNTAYVFGISLPSQANSAIFHANPTLASGDVKISKDGGAFANLTNLPTVTPASGKRVEVSLTSTEMNADRITVIFSDQAGDEWSDVVAHIETTANAFDELPTAVRDAVWNASYSASLKSLTIYNDSGIALHVRSDADHPAFFEAGGTHDAIKAQGGTGAAGAYFMGGAGGDGLRLEGDNHDLRAEEVTSLPTAGEIADEVAARTLDANIVKVNNVTIDGAGTEGDPFGPV